MTNQLFTSPAWYRVLTLSERCHVLAGQPHSPAQPAASASNTGRRYLVRWRNQRPFDADEHFALRLGQLGVDEPAFVDALGITAEALSERVSSPPDWLVQLREAYKSPAIGYFEPPPGEEELGFLNLVQPLLDQALDHLRTGIEQLLAHHSTVPFDPDTVEDVMLMNVPEPLLMRLGRTLVLELNVFRLQGLLDGSTAEQRFVSFVRRLSDPAQSGAVLEEYPVLARQLLICINQWADVSLEFLHRLCADWQVLKSTFSPDRDPGPLVELVGGAGDTHRGGRSVMIAEFESGMRVVYKPKSLAIDVHFQALLSWLNELGCRPPLRTFTTLDRGEYGWAEYVEHQECGDQEQVKRFYRRQGIYLALLYALNATDFHFENVIAAGEHPMLIDLETMLQPQFDRYDGNTADIVAERAMADSVLQIGLLPMRIWSAGDYDGIDISGLGGAGGQLAPDRVPELSDAGTDAMRYVRARVEITGDANRPLLNGVEANAVEYVEEIVTGFETMYRLIAGRKSELLLSAPRPAQRGTPRPPLLDDFAEDSIRVLLRPTRTYGQLLYESFHPDLLRNAIDRDLFFDRLWLVVPERSYMQDVVTSEQKDIQQGDIPVFSTRPASLDLYDASGRPIRGVLTESGMFALRRRIAGLSQEDLQRQVWYIRASIATLDADADGPHLPGSSKLPGRSPSIATLNSDADGLAAPTYRRAQRAPQTTGGAGSRLRGNDNADRSRLLDAARAAADYICATAVQGEKDATWIGLEPQGEMHWAIAPSGIDLYGGAAGIALFLAYAGAVLRESRYTDFSQQAYAAILRQIEYLATDFIHIGGFEGWGGVLYAFTHMGALWRDRAVLSQAERVSEFVRDLTGQDDSFDVARGCAGAILSLLALHQYRPSNALLETASSCGEHLLSAARPSDRGVSWIASRYGEIPLTGYAHGAAGIAVALLRLHSVTGDSAFRDAAVQAMEYERGLFSSEAGNWPDLRPWNNDGSVDSRLRGNDNAQRAPGGNDNIGAQRNPQGGRAQRAPGSPRFMIAWCHGAAGIGLARLQALRAVDDAIIQDEAAAAVATTLQSGFGQTHCLCHGDLGNLELILQASRQPGLPELGNRVERMTAMVLDSIDRYGWQCGGPAGVVLPGLMLGVAGIGYELLRIAEPEFVPSVLVLAPPAS